MDFRPLAEAERRQLITALRGNADRGVALLLDRKGQVILRRPSGSAAHPDPAPILTRDIPAQEGPDIYRHVRVG